MKKKISNNHNELLILDDNELEQQFIDISILTQEMLDCFKMYKMDNNNRNFYSLETEQIKRSLDYMVQTFRKCERRY